jgi:hypothetical protein
MDGFDGPIELGIDNLPKGFQASKATIGHGQISAVLLLSAEETVQLDEAAPFSLAGRAIIDGRPVRHEADAGDRLRLLALMPKPDLLMTSATREVILEPGGKAEIEVSVARQRDYGGRVPIQVMNLPPRVRLLDVGLNGVLINEDEKKRSFEVEALASAEPVEQWIYVGGLVETRSPQQSVYAAPQAIRLVVKPRQRP